MEQIQQLNRKKYRLEHTERESVKSIPKEGN
jgi:hypothetical protein